jgi:TRAP-type C4-dicarboxylate transport system permease small subunit
MIRTVLDKPYIWSGYLAGVFLAGIGVAIIAQVVGRFFRVSIDGTEIAGFCLAATSFFALAHTFKSGSHIRVNLLIRRFTGKSRRLVELWCCGISAVIVGYVAYHAILLSIQSYQFHDISPGLAAMPFWIPQAGMAAGLILLTVALVDELVSVAGNNEPSYEAAKDTALD